jgi:predicted ArsR family transcriptional regulator
VSLQAEVRRLRVLALAAAGEVSAKDASETLDLHLGVAAYYCRDLASKGCLYVSSETRVRGAVQTFYRITPEGEAEMALSLDAMRATLALLDPDANDAFEASVLASEADS